MRLKEILTEASPVVAGIKQGLHRAFKGDPILSRNYSRDQDVDVDKKVILNGLVKILKNQPINDKLTQVELQKLIGFSFSINRQVNRDFQEAVENIAFGLPVNNQAQLAALQQYQEYLQSEEI